MTEHVEIQQWHSVIQASGEDAVEFTWSAPDENGLRHPVPTGGPPVERGGLTWPSDWHADQYVRDCQRELEGIERRMEHVRTDADLFPNERPRTTEERARQLRELENTAAAVTSELERMGGEPAKRKRRR